MVNQNAENKGVAFLGNEVSAEGHIIAQGPRLGENGAHHIVIQGPQRAFAASGQQGVNPRMRKILV